jgi:hypothetical protein
MIGGTPQYTLYGLGLRISSNDPDLLAALHRRLGHFLAARPASCDMSFEFRQVPHGEDHDVGKPGGKTRPVYESSAGDVVYSDREDQLYISSGDGARVLCNPGAGQVRVSLLPTHGAHLWLASHPLFTLPLIELLKRRARYSLHAAGLCIHGKGILFPGTSGAGKSTLALALVRAGFGFLGDDLLFLVQTPEGLRVLGFPDELDLTDETAGFFPELRSFSQQPRPLGWSKRPLRAEDVYPVELAWSCPPAAVVFLRIAQTERSTLEPMEPDEALLELVPNVLLTEADSSQRHLDVLAQLAREARCYRLETGRDFDALPDLLGALVA